MTTSDLRPYPAYKPSGVEWLGDVPAHWEVLPNRAIFSEVNARNCPGEQMLSVTITGGVLPQQELLEDTSKKDSSRLDRAAYKLVQPGDIAYNKMRAWQGAIGVSKYRGIVSPAYVVQRPLKGTNSRYLYYLLRTPAFAKEAERWSYGITSDMWSLRPEHFKMIYACVPPLPEQAAITRFLDHADRRIRRYICAKQKLIALLEEQKQAVIHQAVTGQIDVRTGQPYPAYKPSGVEWLGEVPAHWQGRRLKQICRLVYGNALEAAARQAGSVPVFGSNGGVGFHNSANTKAPCIVIGRKGSFGKVNFSYYPVFAIDTTFYIDGRFSSADIRWLFFLLGMLRLDDVTKDSAIPGLDREDVYQRVAALPSLPEQAAMVAYLDKATAAIDTAIARAHRQIELLQEYRTRLIADVVTGKLDVREAAAALPEVDSSAVEDNPAETLTATDDPEFDSESRLVEAVD